jgi:NAD(P)-dependent dehydrogenase (short-subunit alcohol dehydrogenase family)
LRLAFNASRKKNHISMLLFFKGEAMRIFVTGATGVLGKVVVPGLLADGHVVYALSRSQANTEVLERLGAKPVPADLFDAQALAQTLAGCEAGAEPGRRTTASAVRGHGCWSRWLWPQAR